MLALGPLRTLGLSRILRSSFMVLLDRSAFGPWGLRPGGKLVAFFFKGVIAFGTSGDLVN